MAVFSDEVQLLRLIQKARKVMERKCRMINDFEKRKGGKFGRSAPENFAHFYHVLLNAIATGEN